ncbi:MAG: hypothetical protein NWF14_06360 [Candidatus Bathyarchaeota archaeon]|nr:hypothetical protein [Candidatus Bathyarchaeota archaeon]
MSVTRQIGEKAPFSDTEVTHTLCQPCLEKTLEKLRDNRRSQKEQRMRERNHVNLEPEV